MDSYHKKFIPSSHWKEILCSVDYTHNEQFIIVACTKHGDLIEFIIDSELNTVKDTNSIDIDNFNVQVIKVFFALHDPVRVFYLLHTSANELIIVQKINNVLKIKEKIYKVQKFEILDSNKNGSPQVSVWYANSKEPNLITDFSDQLSEQIHSSEPRDKLANVLKIQLKMLSDKISGRQALLDDKIKLRSEMFESFTQNPKKVNLKINEVVQKIFSGKWFIILHLENKGLDPIEDIKFVFDLKTNLTSYTTFLIEKGTSQVGYIKSLKQECLGVIMLDIPDFSCDKLVLAGAIYFSNQGKNKPGPVIELDNTIMYKSSANQISQSKNVQDDLFGQENCLVIPSVELDINSLLDKSYQCISTSENTSLLELYCIMLASNVKSFSILSIDLVQHLLIEQFHCIQLPVEKSPEYCSYYFCKEGLFNEMLFCVASSKSTLNVYYKTERQINIISLLVKHIAVLNEQDNAVANLSDFQSDVTHCIELLRNEILHDTITNESPRDFFNVNKKHIFEIQKILSKYRT